MANLDIYDQLTKIFREVFHLQEITLFPAMTANDLDGWDSFKQVEIILQVEEAFRISLNSREMDGIRNVGHLADIIASKLS